MTRWFLITSKHYFLLQGISHVELPLIRALLLVSFYDIRFTVG